MLIDELVGQGVELLVGQAVRLLDQDLMPRERKDVLLHVGKHAVGDLLAETVDELLLLLVVGKKSLKLASKALDRHQFQKAGQVEELSLPILEIVVGLFARIGRDAADSRGNRPFADDDKETDLRSRADMRSSAELLGVAHRDDTDLVAVLLIEEMHGIAIEGLFLVEDGSRDRKSGEDLVVDSLLDLIEDVLLDLRFIGEVEAKALVVIIGAFLMDVLADELLEGLLQEMGRRMVLLDFSSSLPIDLLEQDVSTLDRPKKDLYVEQVGAVRALADREDFRLEVLSEKLSRIADLSAALGIEVRLFQDDVSFVIEAFDPLPVLEETDDRRLEILLLIGEGAFLVEVEKILALRAEGLSRPTALPCQFLGVGKELIIPLFVDLKAGVMGDFLRQLEGEAIGVHELEGILGGEDLARLLDHVGEDLLAGMKSRRELLLLALDHLAGLLLVLEKVRIEMGHVLVDQRDKIGQSPGLQTDLLGIARGSSQESLEDIAPAVVGEDGTVGQGEGDGTDVVGDDAIGQLVLRIGNLGLLLQSLDVGKEEVRLEVRLRTLKDAGETLQSCAGIDVLLRKKLVVLPRRSRNGVELGEDDVPELDVAVVVQIVGEKLQAEMLGIVLLAPIEIDFRVRTTGAFPDLPEVALARNQMVLVHSGLNPGLVGVQVVRIVGDIEFLLGKAEVLLRGQKLESPGDDIVPEVVSDREVPHHLEEGVVTGRVPDVLDVVGADALLGIGDASVLRGQGSVEVLLQSRDAGIDPEQGWVILRNQGCRGFDVMAVLLEEFQPDTLILGGMISRSFRFFGNRIREYTGQKHINVIVTEDTSSLIHMGLFQLIRGEINAG